MKLGNVRDTFTSSAIQITSVAMTSYTQAFSLYRSLEDNGVETRFFVFPIRGHSPADPIRQGDMWQVWIDWLVAHKD